MTSPTVVKRHDGTETVSHFPVRLLVARELLDSADTKYMKLRGTMLELRPENGRAVYEHVGQEQDGRVWVFVRRYGEPIEMLREEA